MKKLIITKPYKAAASALLFSALTTHAQSDLAEAIYRYITG